MSNILLLNINAKRHLLDSFLHEASHFGCEVYVADISTERACMKIHDKICVLPKSKNPDYINALLNTCLEHNISLVIPTSDIGLDILSSHCQYFAKHHITLLTPSPKIISLLQDKLQFSLFCKEKGLLTPNYFTDIDHIDAEQYPLMVRSRMNGWKDKFIAKNPEALKHIVGWLEHNDYTSPIITNFLHKSEYSIDVLSNLNGQGLQAVVRERIYLFGGESWRTKIISAPNVEKDALQLATQLKLVGHSVLQCFLSDDDPMVARPIFFEVNPRFGGASNVAYQAGLKSHYHILNMFFQGDYHMKDYKKDTITYNIKSYRYAVDTIKHQ